MSRKLKEEQKMRKNLIALALSVAVVGCAAAANAASVTFTDTNNNWASNDINSMAQMNVMTGYNDNMFHPDAWVTRAEFGNMELRVLGLPSNKISVIPNLQNVTRNSYNFSTIDNQQWLSAYPTGVFRPENPVRRVEVLSALAGALNKPLVSQAEANQILSQYSDAASIPASQRQQVATAIKYNLFAIDPQFGSNVIDPLRPVTRAELASMLSDLNQNRDIAIVQNGQLVSSNVAGANMGVNVGPVGANANLGVGTTGAGTGVGVNVGPVGANVGAGVGVTNNVGGVTTTDMTRTDSSLNTTAVSTDNTGSYNGVGYRLDQTSSHDWWTTGNTPFRNSADTLPQTREISTGRLVTGQQPQELALPDNVTFTGTVAKALYSEFNRPGDPVLLILDHPVFDASGRVVAPAGSQLLGMVTSVIPHNETGGDAQLGLALRELITPAGERFKINATVANADGVLRANQLQGIVIHPERSVAALRREINTAEGGLYGSKQGKVAVLEQPEVTQMSNRPIDPMEVRTSDVIIGVGDRIQVRTGSPAGFNAATPTQ